MDELDPPVGLLFITTWRLLLPFFEVLQRPLNFLTTITWDLYPKFLKNQNKRRGFFNSKSKSILLSLVFNKGINEPYLHLCLTIKYYVKIICFQ